MKFTNSQELVYDYTIAAMASMKVPWAIGFQTGRLSIRHN